MSRPEYLKLPNSQIIGTTQLPSIPEPVGDEKSFVYGGWTVERCYDRFGRMRGPEWLSQWVKYIPGNKSSYSYWLTPTAAVTNIIEEYWTLRVQCDSE